MSDIVATIEIKTITNTPHDFYLLLLGGRNGICSTGSTIPCALHALADKISYKADRVAASKIVSDAIERSMAIERRQG